MNKREKMPFYEAVKLNCPNELSCRIEKLLGDCLPEIFRPKAENCRSCFVNCPLCFQQHRNGIKIPCPFY